MLNFSYKLDSECLKKTTVLEVRIAIIFVTIIIDIVTTIQNNITHYIYSVGEDEEVSQQRLPQIEEKLQDPPVQLPTEERERSSEKKEVLLKKLRRNIHPFQSS